MHASSAIAVALLVAACAAPQKTPARRAHRIALLPPENRSGVAASMADVRSALGLALRSRRVQLIDDAAVDDFVARHHIRYTAGVDHATALAAADELEADGVLVAVVDLYQMSGPAKFGLMLRLVTTGAEPEVAWTDGQARTGNESPGLLNLGLLGFAELRTQICQRLAGSLAAWIDAAGPPATACEPARRFLPSSAFHARSFETSRAPLTVVVLPFLNETQRQSAGELIALQFARHFGASGAFKVVEPGIVRDQLRRYRLVMENGVSLEIARVVLELVHADLVLAGTVYDYQDSGDAPIVDFMAMLLARDGEQVVWQSTSHNRGDDGVVFFRAGRVATAATLSCRMVRSVVDEMMSGREELTGRLQDFRPAHE